MYDIIKLSFKAINGKLETSYCINNFELFGYDFIFDENLTPFLLEINTNPGLEVDDTPSFINKLIPRMIDDALRLTIDVIYKTEYTSSVLKYNNKNNPNTNSINSISSCFCSLFPIEGYNNEENMWQLLLNVKDKDK